MKRADILRISTWNVDHARSVSRDPDRARLIDSADADVIILTETCDRVRPSDPSYEPVHSSPRPHCPDDERWVSIWTKIPVIERLSTEDPLRTVAVRLAAAGGALLVFGTVLPWHADIGDARDEPAPPRWQEHRRVVAAQTQEWVELRARYPEDRLVIAGDWNTDLLAGSGLTRYSYGLTAEVNTLLETAARLSLEVPTRHIEDSGRQRPWLIDHIAGPPGAQSVATVEAISDAGTALSDHPLVSVDWLTTTDA